MRAIWELVSGWECGGKSVSEESGGKGVCVGGERETSGGESVRKSGGPRVFFFSLSCNPPLLSEILGLPVGNE